MTPELKQKILQLLASPVREDVLIGGVLLANNVKFKTNIMKFFLESIYARNYEGNSFTIGEGCYNDNLSSGMFDHFEILMDDNPTMIIPHTYGEASNILEINYSRQIETTDYTTKKEEKRKK